MSPGYAVELEEPDDIRPKVCAIQGGRVMGPPLLFYGLGAALAQKLQWHSLLEDTWISPAARLLGGVLLRRSTSGGEQSSQSLYLPL